MQTTYTTVEDINFNKSPLESYSVTKEISCKDCTVIGIERVLYCQLHIVQTLMLLYCPLFLVIRSTTTFFIIATIVLYSAENMDLSFRSLTTQCNTVYDSLCVTPEQALNLENQTREQTKSKLWHRYRAGSQLQPPYSSTKCQCQIQLAHHRINKESMLLMYVQSGKFYSNATRLPPYVWQLKL